RDRLPHARLRGQARRSAQSLLYVRRHRAARQPRRRDRGRGARAQRFRPGGQGGERMKLAFVVDPLERLKPYTDSSVAMMREAAQREGARVVNDPRALRDWNEKLSILDFPRLIPPTLVTSRMDEVHAFIDAHADVVVKKLDGMGGAMIFRVRSGDVNRNVIVETITDWGARTVMAQRFVAEIAQGDKRVLVIGGRPFGHCLARIPKAGETRGNLAAGG